VGQASRGLARAHQLNRTISPPIVGRRPETGLRPPNNSELAVRSIRLLAVAVLLLGVATHCGPLAVAREPIPDRLVVLTFDDSVKSHFTIVRPILLAHKFRATFFITEGFNFKTDKERYMTWEDSRSATTLAITCRSTKRTSRD
jgi:hypothetical protein